MTTEMPEDSAAPVYEMPFNGPPLEAPDAGSYATLRRAAYVEEADPIFFLYQRGEATQGEWLGKVEEIRARYPRTVGAGEPDAVEES